jgi:hypothetical protein
VAQTPPLDVIESNRPVSFFRIRHIMRRAPHSCAPFAHEWEEVSLVRLGEDNSLGLPP